MKVINTKNYVDPTYTENHVIYFGTQIGGFKSVHTKGEKPHKSQKYHKSEDLNRENKVTALAFGKDDCSEILLGYANRKLSIFDVPSESFVNSFDEICDASIIGVARVDDKLIASTVNGKIYILSTDDEPVILNAGTAITRMRQCKSDRKFIATGGKGRENNLKIFNIETGKQTFTSKNLPNDFLDLEVPVWDCDMVFLEPHILATCSRYGYARIYDIRAQRRPIKCFTGKEEFAYSCMTGAENTIYVGTTLGQMKALDIRKMKNFTHTFKGFHGSPSEILIDDTRKFIASASLDRYIRIHHADTCVMLYQSYVNTEATTVLVKNIPIDETAKTSEDTAEQQDTSNDVNVNKRKRKAEDDEFDRLFDNMPTVT